MCSSDLFVNPVTVTMAAVGSTGVAATGTVTLGGRFGRNLNETLVVLNTVIGDADNNSTFPTS